MIGTYDAHHLAQRRLQDLRHRFQGLEGVDLEIHRGEIFALLGPNGAGKTTLIGLVCGIVKMGGGRITVAGPTSSPTTARRAR